MDHRTSAPIAAHCQGREDPRLDRTKLHRPLDIVAIARCAVTCGAGPRVEVEKFGRAKHGRLRRLLELPHGIPSHDPCGRAFRRIDPQGFQECFLGWIKAVSDTPEGRLIPSDGTAARRSFGTALGRSPLHLVSAWAEANHLLPGQGAVGGKATEITAIPPLLDILGLHGAVVTSDAMGCQKEVARKIIGGGGDYVPAVRANQDTPHDDIIEHVGRCLGGEAPGVEGRTHTTAEASHGREEQRSVFVVPVPEGFRNREPWAGLARLCLVVRAREVSGAVEGPEAFYVISSPAAGAKQVGGAVRGHWRSENPLHWSLGVSSAGDQSRVRKDNAPANLGRLRRIALSLLKRATKVKGGLRAKRLQAGWDEKALADVLAGF